MYLRPCAANTLMYDSESGDYLGRACEVGGEGWWGGSVWGLGAFGEGADSALEAGGGREGSSWQGLRLCRPKCTL